MAKKSWKKLLGHLAFIGIFFQFIYLLQEGLVVWAAPIGILLAVLYYTYTLRLLYRQSLVAGFFNALLIQVGGYILMMLTIAFLGFLTALSIILFRRFF